MPGPPRPHRRWKHLRLHQDYHTCSGKRPHPSWESLEEAPARSHLLQRPLSLRCSCTVWPGAGPGSQGRLGPPQSPWYLALGGPSAEVGMQSPRPVPPVRVAETWWEHPRHTAKPLTLTAVLVKAAALAGGSDVSKGTRAHWSHSAFEVEQILCS